MRIAALIIVWLMMSFNSMAGIDPALILNVSKYPKSFKHTDDLAKRINKDYKSDKDKAAAIYTWIALNVEYDVKTFYSNKNTSVEYSYQTLEEKEAIEKEIFNKIVESTLRKKEAVCEGYASLYKALCDQCRLECVIVSGSSKNSYRQIGKEPKISDHAWNAVMINGQWYLLDATWGAGSVDPSTRKFIKEFTDGYFMLPADRFFTQHFPQDEKWSFVDKSAKDFAELPFYHHTYLFSDDVLLTPEKGIIKKVKRGEIPFKLKTSREINQLYFAFERDKKSSLISYTQQGDEVTFSVQVGNRRSGYFTVYADGKPMFSFKLNTK
nr:transglutaminase domain-containing protein [uncultured Carboxylicivirga sp.]